jgi:hypothetical protein
MNHRSQSLRQNYCFHESNFFDVRAMLALLTLPILLAYAEPSLAQKKTTTIKCSFSSGVFTDFDTGKPRSEPTKPGDLPDLIFDQIQQDSNKARFIGNAGATDVLVARGRESTNLIESTNSGNLNLTTVYRIEKIGPSAGVPAVHSRHVATQNGLIPSQYWGACRELTN